jgi:hypothetical protein
MESDAKTMERDEETTVRRQDAPRYAVPGGRNVEREEQAVHPLPEPWWVLNRAADTGGPGALP